MSEPHDHHEQQPAVWHLQSAIREMAERLTALEVRTANLEAWQVQQTASLKAIEQSTQDTGALIRTFYSRALAGVLGVVAMILTVMLGLLINHILATTVVVPPR